MKLITHYDIILMALIFAIAALLFIKFMMNKNKSVDDMVMVQRNGVILLQLTDDELNRAGIYGFEFDGKIGYIEVKDRRIRMLPMDTTICPQAICSDTGWIDRGPRIIVCMPNQIIVRYKSNTDNRMDGIVF
ncbi:MAG TPA: hypothetical protein DDZ89_22060 [Clostridiales bacterium]|nr:hypothetical protein [Clostridiales bacterium]